MSPLLVAHLAGSYLTMGLFFAPRLYHFPFSEPLSSTLPRHGSTELKVTAHAPLLDRPN